MKGWSTMPVRDLVESVQTWNPLRADHEDVFEYIDLSAIDQTAKVILGAREVTCGEAPSRARQLIATDDILVSTVRPNLNAIAKVNPELDGATASTGFCVLRPRPNLLSSSYLFHWVKSSQFIADMVSKATGASYPAVSDRIIFDSPIPAPPLPEQRRIAAILDKADAIRAKRREALAQLDSLTQSIFIEMFGDPVTNPMGWKTTEFDALCSRVTVGIVVQPASYYRPEGIPAIRSLNIAPGEIILNNLVYFSEEDNDTKLKKTKLKAGDLVLVRTGQPGTAAVVPSSLDGINAIDILIASPRTEKCDATFLCEFFNSAGGRDLVLSSQRGQIQKHLNVGSLKTAIVPMPPLHLQMKFSNQITQLKKLRESHILGAKMVDSLFASLQHRAFRGEL